MRTGLLPESIFNRSVKKTIDKYNKDKSEGTALGKNCAFLCIKELFFSKEKELWEIEIQLCLRAAIYEAAVAGKPVSMQAELMLPSDCTEEELRKIVSYISNAINDEKLYIYGINVKTVREIATPAASFIVLGYKTEVSRYDSREKVIKDISRGNEVRIAVINRIGNIGSVYLANRYRDRLHERYSQEYIRRMTGYSSFSGWEEISSFINGKCLFCKAVGEGGIFASLWNLGVELKCGLEVDIKKIPLFQENIEICNYFDINPYMLFCGDCILFADTEAENLVETLNEAGIQSSIIGRLTSNNDRVIVNSDERRFLTRPEADEIYKVIEEYDHF